MLDPRRCPPAICPRCFFIRPGDPNAEHICEEAGAAVRAGLMSPAEYEERRRRYLLWCETGRVRI